MPPINTNRSKFSFYLFDLNGGGAERVIVTLLNEMYTRKLAVELIVSRMEGPYLSELNPGISITEIGSRSFIYNIYALYKHVKEKESSHLVTTMRGPSIVTLIVKILQGKKIKAVIREANTPSQEHAKNGIKHKLLNTLTRFLYGYSDSIICVSEGVETDFKSFYKNIDTARISTIYNPVINDVFFEKADSEITTALPWPPTSFYFIAVGRFVDQKDYPTLLQAFNIISKTHDVNLLILGDGPLRNQFIADVENLGLESRVFCPGFVDNPFPFMKQADCYVLSSRWEGLPNALVQAVSLGLQTISTDCPSGPREILEGGELGFLIPIQDVDALADAMRRVIASPITEKEKQHIKRVALGKYSVTSITTQYINKFITS